MRDIVTDNPTADELTKWVDSSDKPVAKFFNTSGMRYKALNLKEAVKSKESAELIEILASDGMLVKRPLLITDNGEVLVGFKEEEWSAIIK